MNINWDFVAAVGLLFFTVILTSGCTQMFKYGF